MQAFLFAVAICDCRLSHSFLLNGNINESANRFCCSESKNRKVSGKRLILRFTAIVELWCLIWWFPIAGVCQTYATTVQNSK